MADRPASSSSRLVFPWPERSSSLLLPGVFLLALAAHAAAFYLFQIVYPPIVSIAPPPAQVTLLTPSSPENRALLQWVEAQNPEAAPRLQAVVPPELGALTYTPSYTTVKTLPKPFASRERPSPYPPAQTPRLALPPEPLPAPRAAVPSAVSFSGVLGERAEVPGTAAPLPTASGVFLPTEFLAAVDERGELRYLFLQKSSGNPALDREAEKWLRNHSFQRVETAPSLEWGFATFAWGASETGDPAAHPVVAE